MEKRSYIWDYDPPGSRDRREDVEVTTVRLQIFRYVLLAFMLIVGGRFWALQVLDHEYWSQLADNNRIRDLPIAAPRGNVLDREGRVLVDSRPAWSLVVDRESMRDLNATVDALVVNFGLEPESLFAVLGDRKTPRSRPITVKKNATAADRAWVSAHELEHPELRVEPQPQRTYPFKTLAALTLGYIGEIPREQLEQEAYKDYKQGDIIGRAGFERQYNDLLMGKEGSRRVIVDRLGRIKGELETVPAKPGQDIVTTIDLDLQQTAEDLLAGRRGVIIALDPRDGGILAIVSHPAFDPNLFSQRIETPEGKSEYRQVATDPEKPLINRAIQEIYPTGSAWKPLMTIAGLEEGAITPEHSNILCGGGLQVGNHFFHDPGNHGTPDVHQALVHSCDGYYYRLGVKLGPDKIQRWVSELGMGKKTGIDLPYEAKGTIPSREWKAKVNPRSPKWTDADSAMAGVGQGSVAVTPIQLLHAIAGIAEHGVLHTPHMFLEARATADRPEVKFMDTATRLDNIDPEYFDIVIQGMWGVVNEGGTGARVRLDGFDICGKTGTAQVIGDRKAAGKRKEHAWFVSFAPEKNPEIAVLALVENSGWGAENAAPVARTMYQAYFSKKLGRPIGGPIAMLSAAKGADQPGNAGGPLAKNPAALTKTPASGAGRTRE